MAMSSFDLIPAIDLLDGAVVRLHQGDYARQTRYDATPLAQALAFVRAGARAVHVVDLNAARSGQRGVNLVAIEDIVRAVDGRALVELGGGIRDAAAVEAAINAGVDRVVIGTAAVTDRAFLVGALERWGPQRIIVGVDARDGRVRTAGWEQDGGITALELLSRLEEDGVAQVIFTDIAVDGALTGPATDSLRAVHDHTSRIGLIASGGVSSPDDVLALARLRLPRLTGVIVGRAIYEGRLDVEETVRALAQLV